MVDDEPREGRPAPSRTPIRAVLAAATVLVAVLLTGIAPAGAQEDGPPSTLPGVPYSSTDDHMNEFGHCDPGYMRDSTAFPGSPTCITTSEYLADLGVDPEDGDDDPGWLTAVKSMRLVGFVVLGLGLLARRVRRG